MSGERVNQLIEAGLWLRMSGDVEGARRLFEQARRLDPGNAKVQAVLGSAPAAAQLPQELNAPVPVPPGPGAPLSPRTTIPFAMTEELNTASAEPPPVFQAPRPLRVPPTQPETRQRPLAPPLMTPLPTEASLLPLQRTPQPFPKAPSAEPTGWDTGSSPPVTLAADHAEGDALDVLTDALPSPFSKTPPPMGAQAGKGVATMLKAARQMFALDDHTGVVDLTQKALSLEPQHVELLALRERSERVLLERYESKLGNLGLRPRVLLRDEEVIWLNLDHRAGFVLAQIDGTMSFEEVFLVSGMSRLDTLRILAQLKDAKVIGV